MNLSTTSPQYSYICSHYATLNNASQNHLVLIINMLTGIESLTLPILIVEFLLR